MDVIYYMDEFQSSAGGHTVYAHTYELHCLNKTKGFPLGN